MPGVRTRNDRPARHPGSAVPLLRAAALTALGVLMALPDPAAAQMNVLRSQTRIIERSIGKNLERVFRPKLVVAEGNTGPVTALALSADERLLVSAVGNRTLRVWDLQVGREMGRLPGHSDQITDIAISPDGKLAATGSKDQSVRVWDLRKLTQSAVLTGHAGAIAAVALLPGNRIVSADVTGELRLWSADGAQLGRAALGAGTPRLVAFPDRKRLLAAGGDGTVRVLAAEDLKELARFETGEDALALAVSPDGARAAVGAKDGSVILLDIQAGTTLAEFDAHDGAVSAVGFAPEGGALITGGADGMVRHWARGDGSAAQELGKHDGAVTFAAVSGDATFALTGSEDGTTRLWNIKTAKPLITLLSTETGWAVVDSAGRYDGSQSALKGIEWQGEDAKVNIESFAETHYEAALLPRVLAEGGELGAVPSIPDGVKYPAKIRFVSPTASGSVEQPKVQVEVVAEEDGGSGVQAVRLYRNGRLVPEEAAQIERQQADGSTRVVARYELDLTGGTNQLAATAINADQMESPPQTLVLKAGQPVGGGKVHVMTVGINQYANTQLNLDYAKPDAQALAAFFDTGRATAPVADRMRLEDARATKQNILDGLRRLRSAAPQDLLVIYMAGHGVSVGPNWYYVPHEITDASSPAKLTAAALSSAELKAEIEALGADRILLLLDTCHSGTAVSPLKDYRGMKSLRLLARSMGVHILAATDRNQFAIELQSLGHGVFTYAVLEGMKGKADTDPQDGQVTAAEIIRYVEDQVPRLSQQFADYAQYPTGYSRGIDFPVAR